MAVVQISRIQLRRGKEESGTGVPVLASGELAWAVDTQNLYIGSGSVGEGAPAVGNVKILTNSENLLDYASYIYKDGAPVIQTGVDPNNPTERTLQDKLDDQVFAADYGIISGNDDQSEKLQHAIYNLFLTNAYSGTKSRVVLIFSPGAYSFSETVYLPSFVRIQGAGKQRTVFNYTGTGSAFVFVNDNSTLSTPLGVWNSNPSLSTISNSVYNTQPKHCYLSGFTVNAEAAASAFQLNAVRDSVIEDIEIIGTFDAMQTTYGISMYAYSSVVTCQRNLIDNVYVKGVTYDVYAKQDIFNNRFTNCEFTDSTYGINFGVGANGSSVGEQFGPRKNLIENCYFENIKQEGIRVQVGSGNRSHANTFVDVGNNSGGNSTGLYHQIRFDANGNTSMQDNFDRASDLALGTSSTTYIKEVAGKVQYTENETRQIELEYNISFTNILRFPFATSAGYEINYILESPTYSQMRRGKISISHDSGTGTVQLVDDYDYTGASGQETEISFSAGVVSECIVLRYKNLNSNDINANKSKMTYTYRTIS